MHVAIIGGASTIGTTVAYTLAATAPDADVTLVDVAEDAAWAHATDLSHASYHVANTPGAPPLRPADPGAVRSTTPDELPSLDPDAVVFNAAAPQPPDATDPSAREAELDRNLEIVDDVAGKMRGMAPVPMLVVTNPVDRLTYRFWRLLEWPRGCFLGYSLSETARFADAIGERLGVHPSTVHCPTMGEHGEHVVPVYSRLRVDGDPVDFPEDERAAVEEYVREIPFDIAERRGVEETSRWVTAAGVTRVLRTIGDGVDGRDPTEDVVCLSTPLAGEYGFEDVCLAVPVTLGADGVEEIREWDLAPGERARLDRADEAIRADVEGF